MPRAPTSRKRAATSTPCPNRPPPPSLSSTVWKSVNLKIRPPKYIEDDARAQRASTAATTEPIEIYSGDEDNDFMDEEDELEEDNISMEDIDPLRTLN